MDNVLSGADIDIYGLADATRRRANGMRKALQADGAILSRTDLSTAVRARPDLKVLIYRMMRNFPPMAYSGLSSSCFGDITNSEKAPRNF